MRLKNSRDNIIEEREAILIDLISEILIIFENLIIFWWLRNRYNKLRN